jgi:hypothetical protein
MLRGNFHGKFSNTVYCFELKSQYSLFNDCLRLFFNIIVIVLVRAVKFETLEPDYENYNLSLYKFLS